MGKFKRIYVEIINTCNLSCSFCPKTQRAKDWMEPEFFETILKQIQGHTKHIYLHVLGEPLLHPHLKQILNLCERYEFLVNMTTNGTLLQNNKDILTNCLALRQVNISLHSFPANQNRFTMEEYLEQVLGFVRHMREVSQVFLCLRLWNIKDTMKQEERQITEYVLKRIEQEFHLQIPLQNTLTPGHGMKLGERVFLQQSVEFTWPDMNQADITDHGFCYGLRDHAGILTDGTVIPCCLDGQGAVALGNIKNLSFSEIIQGKRASAIYDGFSRREAVEPLCRKCGYMVMMNR